jgi:hypothetical protein
MKTIQNLGILAALFFTTAAYARGGYSGGSGNETNYMVANGQGVSSPSFWGGVEGENPAGLAWNQRTKIQGTLAAFDDSLDTTRGSGGILLGNGQFGAGLEYSGYSGDSAYPSGDALLNWGLAGRLTTINTTIGISGHDNIGGISGSSYDVGALIDLSSSLRLGALIPDFTNGLHDVTAGITYMLDPAADIVIDGAYNMQSHESMIKPGLTFRADMLQATAAYGFHANGVDDVFLYHGFTGGIGVRLTESVLIEYEYRVLPEHRLGLTLRFN